MKKYETVGVYLVVVSLLSFRCKTDIIKYTVLWILSLIIFHLKIRKLCKCINQRVMKQTFPRNVGALPANLFVNQLFRSRSKIKSYGWYFLNVKRIWIQMASIISKGVKLTMLLLVSSDATDHLDWKSRSNSMLTHIWNASGLCYTECSSELSSLIRTSSGFPCLLHWELRWFSWWFDHLKWN